ncbi:TIGR03943 family protein [Nakamurella endophytica]|uniref:TIGR03943 family protein n=1 Tax=Nakamurella endophytica TaxID=1748367 RepID=A0A917WI50_9ACTN|nr:TIGR03943 family protein [Nakamurella endophytica]
MNRQAQSVLMALVGGVLLAVTVSGRYTSYVKPGFGPLLLLAGGILVVAGVAALLLSLRDDRRRRAEHGGVPAVAEPVPAVAAAAETGHGSTGAVPAGDEAVLQGGHGHDHDRSRAPWLLLAPVLVLLVVAPPALGAEAVTRNAGSQAVAGMEAVQQPSGAGAEDAAGGTSGGYAFNDGSGHGEGTAAFAKRRPTKQFPPLPAGEDPAIGIKEFVLRALYDADDSVGDTPVTVVGFVAPAGDGWTGGYSIARLAISCCAADATPMRIHVDGTPPYPVDTWVSAVVTARAGTAAQDNDYVPAADVVSMQRVTQPADPYEH